MAEDPLESENIASAHHEVTGEHVAKVVDTDPRQLRAPEGAAKYGFELRVSRDHLAAFVRKAQLAFPWVGQAIGLYGRYDGSGHRNSSMLVALRMPFVAASHRDHAPVEIQVRPSETESLAPA